MNEADINAAYAYCLEAAASHYENFPVASRLLPAAMRRPVAAVYAFARRADDLADEDPRPTDARLAALAAEGHALEAACAGAPTDDPIHLACADAIARHRLPLHCFHDLLSAFAQDITCRRYRNFDAVLDYCRRSANPVGRLLLHLHGSATAENLELSDRICTALQLTNFLQDLGQDYAENGRIYLPAEEMARHGVDEQWFAERRTGAPMRALLAEQIERARGLMLAGRPLGRRLGGRFGFELRLIAEGGLRILDRLAATEPFARPRLRRGDRLYMVWRALRR